MRKGSRAKWIALAFATVLVILAGVASIEMSGAGGKSEQPHQLTLPEELVDRYHRHSSSDSVPRGDGGWGSVEVSNWKAVTGKYAVALDEPNLDGVEISGLYGNIADPERVRKALLRGAADRGDTALAVRPEEFFVDADGPEWSCQVVVRGEGQTKTTLPVCAWADSSTAATITFLSPGYMTAPPRRVDLDRAARDAHAIRNEVRKPISE